MRLFDITQVNGIGVPLPRSLKLGIHKSVILETHYWDVQCFTSAQLYRTARPDIRQMFATKEKSAVTKLLPLKFSGLYPHETRRNCAVYRFAYFLCIFL